MLNVYNIRGMKFVNDKFTAIVQPEFHAENWCDML